jgi:GAF domain-containing protein
LKQTFSARPSQRIDRLRWQVPLLAFLLVLTDQIVEHTGLIRLSDWGHFAAQILFYGIIGSLLGWWALASIGRRVRETEAAKTALQTANVALSEAKQRLEFLIHVNHRLSETADEEALRKTILELPFEVVPAVGCSLVQIDDHGQSLPAVHRGFQAQTLYEAWTAHLTSADRGRPCLTCSASWIVDPSLCPHLSLPSKAQMIRRICRLPLARGEREYGQLYIYLADANRPNDREKTLLVATANELAQALESQHLRSRELDVLYRLQRARRMSNLQSELAEVLTHTVDALEVDSGVLFLADAKTAEYHLIAEAGQPLDAALPLVRGLTDGTRRFETPLVISELEPDPKEDSTFRSLLVAPLPGEDRPLGSFVLGARQPDAFTRRHVRLMTMRKSPSLS